MSPLPPRSPLGRCAGPLEGGGEDIWGGHPDPILAPPRHPPVSFPAALVPSSQVTLPGHHKGMVKSKSARRHWLGWREAINLKKKIDIYKIIIKK